MLIDERNRYTELSLDRLFYAVQWKDHLLLAGGSGIFDYDARLHSWKRQAAETISAIGPCAILLVLLLRLRWTLVGRGALHAEDDDGRGAVAMGACW